MVCIEVSKICLFKWVGFLFCNFLFVVILLLVLVIVVVSVGVVFVFVSIVWGVVLNKFFFDLIEIIWFKGCIVIVWDICFLCVLLVLMVGVGLVVVGVLL